MQVRVSIKLAYSLGSLHHKSLESQIVYTEPDRVRLNRAIEAAQARVGNAEDGAALHAFRVLAQTEGILPALESSHALAYALRRAPLLDRSKVLIINLSGRGDKDLQTVMEAE